MTLLSVSSKTSILLLLIVISIDKIQTISNPAIWLSNPSIQAGILNIYSDSNFINSYIVPYSNPFSSYPNSILSTPSLDLVSMVSNPPKIAWSFFYYESTVNMRIIFHLYDTQAINFKVCYLSADISQIYIQKIPYIVFDQNQILPLTSGTGIRKVSNSKSLGETVDSTHNLHFIAFLSGLTMYTKNGDYGFQFTVEKLNNTSFLYNATCYGTTTITGFVIRLLMFDITIVQLDPYIMIDYQPFIGANNQLILPSLVYHDSNNLIIGINSFQFTNGFSFSIDTNTLLFTIPNSTASFINIKFSFWSFKKLSCPIVTPYYQKISNLCYDNCPTGFFKQETPIKYCQSCNLFMAQCIQCISNTSCSKCASNWVLNSYFTGCILQNTPENPACIIPNPLNYSKCLACQVQNYFVYSSLDSICICQKGYKLSANSKNKCQSHCGDAITILINQQCDDGNTRNNDGCDQNCKKESGFTCTPSSPSQCTLNYDAGLFKYNYAYKYDGKNKCKFSFSLLPAHPSFQFIDWSKYLSFNISSSFIVPNSTSCTYSSQSNEISLEFEFVQVLQDLTVQAKLSLSSTAIFVAKTSGQQKMNIQKTIITHYQLPQKVSSAISSTTPTIVMNPSQLSVIINLKGANAALVPQSESILAAYQSASIVSLVVTILVMGQFFIATYFHKMIGLQTVQVLQFIYFGRMIINQSNTFFMNSLNSLKYSAYGGYTNYEVIYGTTTTTEAQSLTNLTVDKDFVSVGLMRYFLLNVNFPLILPALSLIIYGISLILKYRKRNQYFQSKSQFQKDEYTAAKRRSKRIYDNAVFPFINVLNMAALFCTILYEESFNNETQTLEESSNIKLIEKMSFYAQISVLFVTFLCFTNEAIQSYEDYQKYKMTDEERARIPKSLIEKLQHDKNDPNRPNYKPGYILAYLIYYLVGEVFLIFNNLIEQFKQIGVQALILEALIYLILIIIWKPYSFQVDYHNKILILNQLVILIFLIICQILNRVKLQLIINATLTSLVLLLIIIVMICGYTRLYIEYKFRKKLLNKNQILFDKQQKDQKEKKQKLNNKDHCQKNSLLLNNKYIFQNQIQQIKDQNKKGKNKLNSLLDMELDKIKQKMRLQFQNKYQIPSLQYQNCFQNNTLQNSLIRNKRKNKQHQNFIQFKK